MGRGPNVFASSGIDRLVQRRREATWLESLGKSGAARVVVVWRSLNLIRYASPPRAVLPRLSECGALLDASPCVVFLGEFKGHSYVAVELDDASRLQAAGVSGEFANLHQIGNQLEQWEGGLLAYARGMLHWHSRHRYCGVCGWPTTIAEAGHVRVCTNEACATAHFPRTDPAIIVLVTDGERCLLGRQPHWDPGKYSTIAGFVEPGESLEDAVRREVLEETGVHVSGVSYHSSQPWPFPASIMLGFTATAASRAIEVDRTELEEARWLSKDELLNGLRSGEILLPSDVSIAYRLVRDWMDGQDSPRDTHPFA